MNRIVYLVVGTVFGLILYKSEVISWFRIQEMFRFDAFHMYGVLGAAVAVGALSVALLRGRRAVSGGTIDPSPKALTHGNWIGGICFGMGWALTGACPGPLFAHLGAGNTVMAVALGAAILGTWTYAALRPRLPH